MMDVDRGMAALCDACGALYQRYSDDILVICRIEQEARIRDALLVAVKSHKLEIKAEKTERAVFDAANPKAFQYLGFNVTPSVASIRPSSLAPISRSPRSPTQLSHLSTDFAIRAKVYAVYLAYTDHEIGRVIQAVEDMGKLDDTLII